MGDILNGHRDSDKGKEFIYSQGNIYIIFILCESDGKFNAILERSIFLSNVITKYDTDDARCPNRKNSEPRHPCTPSLPHIQTTVNLSLSSILFLLLPLAK